MNARTAAAWWWLGAAALTLLAATGDVVYSAATSGTGTTSGHGAGSATSTTVQVLGEHQDRATPATGNGTSSGSGNDGNPKDFAINGQIGGLYPGAQLPLTLTFTNPNNSAIRITQLSITVNPTSAGCPSSLLSFGSLAATVVPKNSSAVAQVIARMSLAAGNSCEGVRWNLSYSGQAVKA